VRQVKKGVPQAAVPPKPRQPQRPFEVIACDVIGPYPETPAGFRYIFVVTDLFSRWVEAFPTAATPTAEAIRIIEETSRDRATRRPSLPTTGRRLRRGRGSARANIVKCRPGPRHRTPRGKTRLNGATKN
jgi:hypothetical protein